MLFQKTLLTDDVVVFGVLAAVLGLVFMLEQKSSGFWPKFFKLIPALLLCYILPALLNSFNIISADDSNLYSMAKNYLLPTSLVLLTLSIDLKAIFSLGPKALIMFITGTVGVIIGGPIALAIFGVLDPTLLADTGSDSVWRGLSTVAGSWIGGGANQTAMFEISGYNPESYSAMLAVDVIVYNFWMALLIWGVGKSPAIDRYLGADTTAIENLKTKAIALSAAQKKPFDFAESMKILGIGFGITALSHLLSGIISEYLKTNGPLAIQESFFSDDFFWLVVLATTFGLLLSFTKAKKLESSGASKWGTIFLYFLIATIGMRIDLGATFTNGLFIGIGFLWIIIHGLLLFTVAKIIKAPYFYIAVGSTANVGGAASAPVVAGAFHPSLASVGVLLAVLGYAAGTYGAIICANLMEWVSK